MSDALKHVRVLDLAVLNDLDFDPDLPCEQEDHAEKHWPVDAPAAYLMRFTCLRCKGSGDVLICESGWIRFQTFPTNCNACGFTSSPGEGSQILQTLRSRQR